MTPSDFELGLPAQGWVGEAVKVTRRGSGCRLQSLQDDLGGQTAGEACTFWFCIQGLHHTFIHYYGETLKPNNSKEWQQRSLS